MVSTGQQRSREVARAILEFGKGDRERPVDTRDRNKGMLLGTVVEVRQRPGEVDLYDVKWDEVDAVDKGYLWHGLMLVRKVAQPLALLLDA